jgi:hypothetical protein
MNTAGPASETQKQRVDRELLELLQELRVVLPGVQVLFAFLLMIPFSQGFPELNDIERYVYFTSLLCAAVATTLLMSPTAYHRIHFRQPGKERLVITSSRLAIAGLLFLAVAMALAVFVIASKMFGLGAGVTIAAAVAGVFGWFWYGLPIARKLGNRGRERPEGTKHESRDTQASASSSGEQTGRRGGRTGSRHRS